jgi:hypothetical protein
MVPATTARVKIASAPLPMIEKFVPTGMPLGAVRATSVAGGREDPGWDPAGTRNARPSARRDASAPDTGGRAMSAEAATPASGRRETGPMNAGAAARTAAAVSSSTGDGATM